MLYEQRIQSTNNAPAISVAGVGKHFKTSAGDLWALRDVSFTVAPGKVLGLLGHNGAGKTTMIKILTTACAPSTGQATVAGFDVATDPARVRERIGVASQGATVDGLLSARGNLVMIGRLYHLPKVEARRRADALLERLDLSAHADRLVKDFSGGMRRRLDLAASLIASPPVLFLDEPTTGLDPHSRNELWAVLRERVRDGATLVLTTQYLEEADRLADDVIVLDKGRIAAHGTPGELKDRIGGERIVVTTRRASELEAASRVLATFSDSAPVIDGEALHAVAAIKSGTRLVEVVRALDLAGVDAHDVSRREVTLDDVFLAITQERRQEAA